MQGSIHTTLGRDGRRFLPLTHTQKTVRPLPSNSLSLPQSYLLGWQRLAPGQGKVPPVLFSDDGCE